MYCVTAIYKMDKDVPRDVKYSNGMTAEDNTLRIVVRNDNALREIVTGLIHEEYIVTIEPGIYFDGEKKMSRE